MYAASTSNRFGTKVGEEPFVFDQDGSHGTKFELRQYLQGGLSSPVLLVIAHPSIESTNISTASFCTVESASGKRGFSDEKSEWTPK